jgi:hypothetical protein
MHCLTTELRTVLDGTITAGRQRSTITLAEIESVIDVPVKTSGPAIPGPRAYKYSTGKPLRPVIAVRCAIVRRRLIVSIRTNGRRPQAYGNSRVTTSRNEKTETNR